MNDSNRQTMNPLEPKQTFFVAYLCPKCNQAFMAGDYALNRDHGWAINAAKLCCGPWQCNTCGKFEVDGKYKTCPQCNEAKRTAAWRALQEVEYQSGMIYADGKGRWFSDLDDYLEHCLHHEFEPAAGLPVIGEPYKVAPPDLYDLAQDDLPEDWDCPDYIKKAQEAVNRIYAEEGETYHSPEGKTRPKLPTLAELQAEDQAVTQGN